jgi:hypothetical protein
LTAGVSAETARLQVIHNAADPGAAVVDVYVNGSPFIDEFQFRAATEFKDVPAGVELEIGVAPGGNSTPSDILATFPVVLEAGKTYVAIANGVLDTDAFDSSVNGSRIAFSVFPRDDIRESSKYRRGIDLIAFHGATDAPAVDIRLQNWPWIPLVSNLNYGMFSYYRTLFPRAYILDITPAGDMNTVVASFEADLRGLQGGAAVVFASGFLNPAANQNGVPFGLFAALPNGDVVELRAIGKVANVQVIHNAADPAAAVVDIYLDGKEIVPDFAFREATPFVELPAGREIVIGVAPGNSAGPEDIIAEFPVTLEVNEKYVVMANGVLDPEKFVENPEKADISFQLFPRGNVKTSGWSWVVNILAFHGATDAPTVDIFAQRRWWNRRLVDNLSYGSYSHYNWLLPKKYTLGVTPGGDNSTVVAAYEADLSGLGGGAAVVFASGFLNPAANQNGPAFGLFVALPDGNVIALRPAGASAVAALQSTIDGGPQAAEAGTPEVYNTELGQNFPNPFNPTTTIQFTLADAQNVSLNVYNVRGQLVRSLLEREALGSGPHSVPFNGDGLASGVYFYRIEAGSFVEMRKMVLMK